jgi:hypothetical protein
MKGYCIKNKHNTILVNTVREDENTCIIEFEKRFLMYNWEALQNLGYTCVQVEIKEIILK